MNSSADEAMSRLMNWRKDQTLLRVWFGSSVGVNGQASGTISPDSDLENGELVLFVVDKLETFLDFRLRLIGTPELEGERRDVRVSVPNGSVVLLVREV